MNKKENNKAWVGLDDKQESPLVKHLQDVEFNHVEEDSSDSSRRDFLKMMGFGLGAATVASCEIPIKKAIPYVVKPEEIVPGVATYYASSIVHGGDVTPALVKTREGRPILVQGNKGTKEKATFTKGGSCVQSQASVLSLYDTERLKYPGKVAGDKVERMSWADLDAEIAKSLDASANIRLVSQTNNSPSFHKAFELFKAKYPSAQLVQYDSISCSAILEANEQMYGMPWVPSYYFEKAKCIVGIDADFLNTWVSSVEYGNGYVENRKVEDKDIKNAKNVMSTHIQFEARMSLTGSNADHRVLIKPSEMGAAVGLLYKEVCSLMGKPTEGTAPTANFSWTKAPAHIRSTAKKLVDNKGKALVVCGINDVNTQIVVNRINELIGAVGKTIVLTNEEHSRQRLGRDAGMETLVKDLNDGKVDALIVCPGANPAYDLPGLADKFAAGLNKAAFSVSLDHDFNETGILCKYMAPDRHNLETWGDVEPKKGEVYIIQPTIAPLFDSRIAGESLLTWSGNPQNYHEFMKANWKATIFPAQREYMTFNSFWTNTLHDGWCKLGGKMINQAPIKHAENHDDNHAHDNGADATNHTATVETVVATSTTSLIATALSKLPVPKTTEGLEVVFYETGHIGNGNGANNPWLQEFPDPIMRTTWDNFIQIPIKWEEGNKHYTTFENLKDGDYANITINGTAYKLPVFRTFGQLEGTVSIALGYGRTRAGKCGDNVGLNLYPEVKGFNYHATNVSMASEGTADDLFACLQMHHTFGLNYVDEATGEMKMRKTPTGEKPFNVDEHIEGFQGALVDRSVFFQSNADNLEDNIAELAKKREGYQYLNSKGLYPEYEIYKMGHHWGMVIDMNSCTGCGACVIACHAENNVPVVGKHEVSIAHDMTWLRIDRYFYGNQESPHAAYMPMMCQHCDNAPCENVCPVAATNHSSEGLNQMTYNRCVGTRYCANNCPFKVRRFNWLDYTSADLFPSNEVDLNQEVDGKEYMTYMTDNLTRMVLNPDVTVRSRGVIEKCSFCVQKLQEAKLTAKVEGRRLVDGDIDCACGDACSTGAIVFGDMNDSSSKVSQMMDMKRVYIPLEETNVKSSVHYLMKVNNRDKDFGKA